MEGKALAVQKNLAIEKYTEIGGLSKAPEDSITRNCLFNKGPPGPPNKPGLGKTRLRQSKNQKETSGKNSAAKINLNYLLVALASGILCVVAITFKPEL